MNDIEFLNKYYEKYRDALFNSDVTAELLLFRDLCLKVRDNNKKLIIAGNGASASIASHGATDFTKQAKVRALAFNDHNLITAFGNDYGYERWVAEAISAYYQDGDAVILISSSGRSPNILEAAKRANELRLPIVTFSGFSSDNPLSKKGEINFCLDSKAYNIIEAIHGIWLTMVVDLLIGKCEYSV